MRLAPQAFYFQLLPKYYVLLKIHHKGVKTKQKGPNLTI